MNVKKIITNYIQYFILIVVVLFMCIPLFKHGFIDTHDGHYYVIYPPLVTYIGAILKLFVPTYTTIAIKGILILLTFISAFGMYKLMMEITGRKSISLITAVIYISAPYRLTDIYVRLAIGEVLALAFMPILFQGLYNLFNKDGKKDYLIVIGTVAIMLSHNISTLLIAGISVIYVLINITKLKEKRVWLKLLIDAVFVITIVGFFYGPLLESKLSSDYAAFDEGFSMSKDELSKQVLHINQLFDNSFKTGSSIPLGENDDGTNELSFAIGLQIIIPLLLVPFIYKKIKKESKKHYLYCLILGLFCIVATTKAIPWNKVPDILVMIQVPWRLLMPATFLLSMAAGLTLYYEYDDIKPKYIFTIIVAICVYIVPCFYNLNYIDSFEENTMIETKFGVVNSSNFEYFPSKARNNVDYVKQRKDEAIIIDGTATIKNQQKDGTKMSFDIIKNDSDSVKIELPYIFYVGYNATLNGEKIQITESDMGFLEINVNEHKTGKIEIRYSSANVMNVTKVISIISVFIFVLYCLKDKIIYLIKNRNKILELYKKYKEVINYLVFGVLATIVNFVSYFIAAKLLGIEEVVSSGISWFCSVLFAYITNKIFVFESKTHGLYELIKEMTSFFLARIISGALCDVGTFAIMVKVIHINDVISKLVTQVMVVIVNYIFSKLIIFKKEKKED